MRRADSTSGWKAWEKPAGTDAAALKPAEDLPFNFVCYEEIGIPVWWLKERGLPVPGRTT